MNNYQYYNWYQPTNYYGLERLTPSRDNLFNPTDGFDKGNMFTNLYEQYKNYMPKSPVVKNEQEKLLYDLQAVCFAAHDLNLYLDVHPEDQSMFMLFQDYQKKAKELTMEYEKKYGPLTVGSNQMNSNTFDWENSPWPWEGYRV